MDRGRGRIRSEVQRRDAAGTGEFAGLTRAGGAMSGGGSVTFNFYASTTTRK